MPIQYNATNKAMFAIQNTALRYTWTAYFVFIFLSSLIGDTLILVAAIKFRAFRLHRFIVVIMGHMAICDLLVAIFFILPRITSLIADRWVMGESWCYLNPYTLYYLNGASMMFVCVLAFFKLVILKFPRSSRTLTSKKAHFVSALVWIYSLILPVTFLSVDKSDVWFDYKSYICDYGLSKNIWKWLTPVLTTVFMAVPNLAVIILTILLVAYLIKARRVARRTGRTLRSRGILTTILIATVYCVSVLPYAVYRMAEFSVKDPKNPFHEHFFKIAQSFVCLNTISNFYIYSLTIPSFREFLLIHLQQSYQSFLNTTSIFGKTKCYFRNLSLPTFVLFISNYF